MLLLGVAVPVTTFDTGEQGVQLLLNDETDLKQTPSGNLVLHKAGSLVALSIPQLTRQGRHHFVLVEHQKKTPQPSWVAW